MKADMAFTRVLSAAFAALLCAAASAAAAPTFLMEFEDLPLAPGLAEVPGGVLFDSPSGRIMDATAEGQVSRQDVVLFYAETLPQLGWKKVSDRVFQRDNEVLQIEIDSRHRPLSVRFSVVPK